MNRLNAVLALMANLFVLLDTTALSIPIKMVTILSTSVRGDGVRTQRDGT